MPDAPLDPPVPPAAADAPDLYQRLLGAGDDLLLKLQAARADGRITLSEAWGLLVDFSHKAVLLADIFGTQLTGPQKRRVVDAAAAAVFDLAWPYVSRFGGLAFLRFLPQAAVRALFLYALDQVIEGSVRFQTRAS
jgi:hypothetical protein